MSLIQQFLSRSPYTRIVEHTNKVHEVVKLLKPLTEAWIAGDREKINELHHNLSALEYEADQIKDSIRKFLFTHYFLSANRELINIYLSQQDDVADTCQDFAVLLRIRNTPVHPELREPFLAYANKVIEMSELLLTAASELNLIAETGFTGKEAEKVLEICNKISEQEWESDKIERRVAEKFYSLEKELDPVTIMMYDKLNIKLGSIANNVEKVAKYLKLIIGNP